VPASSVISYCRACPANCGIKVTVEDGVATRVTGDPDHPLSRGYICPKGRKSAALPDDPHRLDFPMMRNSRGELVTVDWDTAIGDVAARLARIRDRFGAYAVGNYSGTTLDSGGRFMALKLLGAMGSPSRYTSSTVDSVAKVLVPKLMAGREGLVPAVDFDSTSLLLVIGENMVVSHGGFSYFPDPVRYLRGVTRRGEVWVLDPRKTETARLASRHLTPRSGTDFAVLAHLVREILRDGADIEYLASHAERLDDLRRAVEPLDRETTAELTGLAGDDLSALLNSVKHHRRLSIITGTGVTMSATANVTEWMAYALQIVTGSFERPGGRWFNHTATFSPSTGTAPDSSQFGPGPRTHPDIPRMANQYPCAVMAAEIEQGHLKALLVTGGNPMTAFPQPDRLGRALDQLEVLAVWDIVPSATAERATHLFPSPDPLERADLIAPVHLSMVYAQYTPPVVPARADRRPMWWSLAKVGQAMGVSVLPEGAEPDAVSDEQLFNFMVAGTPVSWEQLREAEGRPVPFDREDRWVERTVLPAGRWNLAPPLLLDRLEPALARPRHPLVLGNRREVQHTNSTMAWGVGDGPAPEPYLYINPIDADSSGITAGALVEVRTPHGVVRATARLEEGLSPGTVTIPHGFSEPNVGHLTATDFDLDPLTGMPTLVGVPVTLQRAN
jgi:anaerobic selenocysteine-containing dehydrogenase